MAQFSQTGDRMPRDLRSKFSGEYLDWRKEATPEDRGAIENIADNESDDFYAGLISGFWRAASYFPEEKILQLQLAALCDLAERKGCQP